MLEHELTEVFKAALTSGRFIGGPLVEEFEKAFARFCGTKYSVGVSSGTDALRFALTASGVKEGDAVITAPNTFIATTEAITQAGAVALFVDVDDPTMNMDPTKLARFLNSRCAVNDEGKCIDSLTGRMVSAVVPVHLYGQTADMDPILSLAQQFNLRVIEDACQAHGAHYFSEREQQWIPAGAMGDAAAFSFYPGKNLGAMGEGGAVTTDREDVAQIAAMLRDHGQTKKYFHDLEGYNGRLDAIQAGFLRIKLEYLPGWNEARRRNADLYRKHLGGIKEIRLPEEPQWARGVYHLFVIRIPFRDRLKEYLANAGIGTGLHYPLPLHLQKAYRSFGLSEGSFPVTEKAAKEILSLPMYPELTEEQIKSVAAHIREFVTAPALAWGTASG